MFVKFAPCHFAPAGFLTANHASDLVGRGVRAQRRPEGKPNRRPHRKEMPGPVLIIGEAKSFAQDAITRSTARNSGNYALDVPIAIPPVTTKSRSRPR
jgi:hypothetical protein